MVQGKIQLLDDKVLLQQLRNVTEERSQRGQIDVRPSSGKDDQAVALALARSEVMKHRPPDIFEAVLVDLRPSRAPLHLDPENCGYAAPCENHPDCLVVGYCLDFKSKIVSVPLTRIRF